MATSENQVINNGVSTQGMPDIFTEFPVQFTKTDVVTLELIVDREIIRGLVPDQVEINPDNKVLVYLATQRCKALDYDEVVVVVPVSCNGKSGDFMNVLYLDNAAPIVAGRELLGSPKVDSDISAEWGGNHVQFSLSRGGEPLIKFKGKFGDIHPETMPVIDTYGFAMKVIPSIEGPGLHSIKTLVSFSVDKLKYYNIRMAEDFEFEYHPSAQHYLSGLGDYKIASVSYAHLDFILGFGAIEHDYLKQ